MTFGQTVLVVEDDDELRGVLGRGLREEGFTVVAVATGAELLERIAQATPDALVLDIGLPDTDGRDLCQALRARGIETPVLFLTARDALVDRIAGFDAGGDDYLAKPFAFVELVARLQALLRRSGGNGALETSGLRLDPVGHAHAPARGPRRRHRGIRAPLPVGPPAVLQREHQEERGHGRDNHPTAPQADDAPPP